MKACRAAWLVGAALLLVDSAYAQSTQPAPPVFKTGTDIVTLTATVAGEDGRPVANLRKEDFVVLEDGKPQEISFFNVGEELPLTLAIAIDTSGSMVDKIDDVEDAVEHLLRRAKPQDEVFLLQFSDEADLIVEGAAPSDRGLREAIGDLEATGSTALYDAVIEGLEAAQRGKHRKKVLLLVTDGNDTSSQRGRREAVDAAKRAEVLVYCLGIGHGRRGSFGHASFAHSDRVDIDTLRDLAEPSGGRAYLLEDPHRGGGDLIDNAIVEIGRELRQQYTLGYYPGAASEGGSYRRIKLETRNPALKVRTRKGYWRPVSRSSGFLEPGSRGSRSETEVVSGPAQRISVYSMHTVVAPEGRRRSCARGPDRATCGRSGVRDHLRGWPGYRPHRRRCRASPRRFARLRLRDDVAGRR